MIGCVLLFFNIWKVEGCNSAGLRFYGNSHNSSLPLISNFLPDRLEWMSGCIPAVFVRKDLREKMCRNQYQSLRTLSAQINSKYLNSVSAANLSQNNCKVSQSTSQHLYKSIIVADWTKGLSNLLWLIFKKLCSQLGKQQDPEPQEWWLSLLWQIKANDVHGKKHMWEWWVVLQRTWLALNFLQQVWDENKDWTTPSVNHWSVSPGARTHVLWRRGTLCQQEGSRIPLSGMHVHVEPWDQTPK